MNIEESAVFTGIIEEIGTVRSVQVGSEGGTLKIAASRVVEGVRHGDSIAVDGCCLTAVHYDAGSFAVEISPETVERTTLRNLRPGSRVNLERALRLGDRMGGHYVNGHVDGVGRIASVTMDGNSHTVSINVSAALVRYIVEKGSVAVDGISLTVAGIMENTLSIAVIPATAELTTLIAKGTGGDVNIEIDILGKYVERFLGLASNAGAADAPSSAEQPMTRAFLAKHGFVE